MTAFNQLSASDLRTLAAAVPSPSEPALQRLGMRYCPNIDAPQSLKHCSPCRCRTTPAAVAMMLTLLRTLKHREARTTWWTSYGQAKTPKRPAATPAPWCANCSCQRGNKSTVAAMPCTERGLSHAGGTHGRKPDLKVECTGHTARLRLPPLPGLVRRFAYPSEKSSGPGRTFRNYTITVTGNGPQTKAALHAKCVVVDRAVAFVSSANFTKPPRTATSSRRAHQIRLACWYIISGP